MKSAGMTVLLIATLLVGLLLRLRLSADVGLHKWDERFHALVAKNVITEPFKPTLYSRPALPYDYKKWYANHVWLHKPPLPLWLIAVSLNVVGINELAVRLPSIILSTLAILLIYFLGKRWYSTRAGLLAAGFCAINGLLIELASGRVATDHYDTLFMFFILLAIWLAQCDATSYKSIYVILTGTAVGLALLTKWLPALICFPVYALLLLDQKVPLSKITVRLLAAMAVACVIALPWQLYIKTTFPLEATWESHYNWIHLTQELEGHTDKEGVYYFLNRLRINYSELIYLPLLYLIYRVYKERWNYKLWALAVWIFVPLIVFSLAKMKMQGYLVIAAPALFLVSANFFWMLFQFRKSSGLTVAGRVFVGLLLIALIVLPVRYCFERTAFGFKAPKENHYTDSYRNLLKLPSNAIVLNVEEPIEFMFFNGGSAYQQDSIAAEQRERLRAEGFIIYRYRMGELDLE